MSDIERELLELANEYRQIAAEMRRLTERLQRCQDKMRGLTATLELMEGDGDGNGLSS